MVSNTDRQAWEKNRVDTTVESWFVAYIDGLFAVIMSSVSYLNI